jgi:hypothetical protein
MSVDCLHLESRVGHFYEISVTIFSALLFRFQGVEEGSERRRKWRQQTYSKRPQILTSAHSCTCQKTGTFIKATVRNTNIPHGNDFPVTPTNRFVISVETGCVFCEVGTEFICVILIKVMFQCMYFISECKTLQTEH